MVLSIRDYLLDHGGVDWPEVLSGWAWLLPAKFELWLVNRFVDLFVVLPDGTVHMLDVGAGTFSQVAANREDFYCKIEQEGQAEDWLMIPLIDQLVAAGLRPGAGECYGFRLPPAIGGEYAVENVATLPVWDYLGATGAIHEQLRDVPDGTEVVLKVIPKQ